MWWPTPHTRAWYSYSFASEMYSFVGLAMIMPLTLEKMARSVGYWAPELIVSCLTPVSMPDGTRGVCKALIFGHWIETTTFSLWIKSSSVFLQAFIITSIGPFADDPFWRKRLLISWALFGALATSLFLFFPTTSTSWVPPAAGLINIISYIAYSISVVCANAFLPLLAKEDVAAQRLDRVDESESQSLIRDEKKILSLSISRISATCFGIGCFASIFGFGSSIIVLAIYKGSIRSLEAILGCLGIWWALFTIPAFGLPGGKRGEGKIGWTGGWKRIGALLVPSEIRQLPNLWRFIVAWFFLSDAFHTLPITIILYASSRLGVTPVELITLAMIMSAVIAIADIALPYVQKAVGLTNRTIMVVSTIIAVTVPIWGCLGLLVPWAGFRTKASVNILFPIVGAGYVPFFAYARAVFGEMIPPGHESTFFSLFALTDKSASFAGPLLVGLITQLTGEVRYSFLLLACMMLFPLPLLLMVDVREGHEQARRWGDAGLNEETQRLLAEQALLGPQGGR